MLDATIKVFDHTTLRDFLKTYSKHKKSTLKGWTLKKWSEELGLQATTSITMIINGQRNCGRGIENKLINYFQFNDEERTYFKVLVARDKVREGDVSANNINATIAAQVVKKRTIQLSEEEMSKIYQWHYFTIRQLAKIKPVQRNENWLRSKMQYSGSENLVDCIDTLESLGLISQTDEGLIATDAVITTSQDVSSEPVKKYHHIMGEQALTALKNYPVEKRSFQGCTMAISSEQIPEAKKLINKFVDDFDALIYNRQNGDSVYQLNLQFFPLAVINE